MQKHVIFVLLVLFALSVSSHAQIRQAQRAREVLDRTVRADTEQNGKKPGDTADPTAVGRPKPSAMNVNVRTVLAKIDYKNFAEASAKPAARIADGDPLWLYVKFDTRVGDYVVKAPDPEKPGEFRHLLYAEIGPQNDVTTLNRYILEFNKEDLAAQELKINLAPGLNGRNRSIPVFLASTAASRPGVWHSEIRLTNSIAFPRALTDNLAKSPFTLDLSSGQAKYKAMEADYDSLVLRGTTDVSRIPAAGTFYNEKLKNQIEAELRSQGISPQHIYFAGDTWSESAAFLPQTVRTRKVYAVFTYKRGASCFYGTARAEQTFDAMSSAFGEAALAFQKDLPIACAG